MSSYQEFDHLRIPLEDIKRATNNFAEENLIVIREYGKLYKGELLRPEGLIMCAFKRVNRSFRHGYRDFMNEIGMLLKYRHDNIVSLVGFCNERDDQIIVAEFLANGSLDRYLGSPKLTWSMRLEICLGVARGLTNLRYPQGSQLISVIHRDIKSANIVLDKNWQPKITNLGLSIIRPDIHSATKAIVTNGFGTIGYVDPLYLDTRFLTKESDIYSFGVVLFEVLCGRLACTYEKDVLKFLSKEACLHFENGTLSDIIDPILKKQMHPKSLNTFSTIAYHCVQRSRKERPTILEITKKLEEALALQHEFDKALLVEQVQNMEHMKIPLKDIKLATNDFAEEFRIGRGGFGKVYKAVLSHFDVKEYNIETRLQIPSMIELLGYPRKQSTVAIKRLDHRLGQGTQQFMQEISILPSFRHQNLVTLVGFYDEDHECILVYEYASNGSLDEYIGKSNSTINLRWALRLQICLDVARGLNFLHNSVGEFYRIIHRDLKSSNILLDENWKGMISDFGLSKIGPSNLQATFLMTQVVGTFGYIDPLYQKTGMLTKETDVYSFGVVLFELLCGRLARMPNPGDDLEFIPDMAKRYFNQKKIYEIVDSKLKEEFEKAKSSIVDMETCPDSINIFAAIAYQCLEEKREDRPSIGKVVEQLDKALKSHERFRQLRDEGQSSQGPKGPPMDEVSLWEQIVGGWRKGRLFGFGTSHDPHYSVITECSDNNGSTSSSEINELREKLQKVEEESKTREDRYQTQLELERKLREDMVEEHARVTAQLVEQIALTHSLAAFLQQQGYTPPPGPPPRPPPS